jgi:hypothetical protein
MRKLFISLVAVLAIIISMPCQGSSKQKSHARVSKSVIRNVKGNIPYTIAKNYFVRNDVTDFKPKKIDTQKDFENVFGMAAFMGKDGEPTNIDFGKQYVLAVMMAPTNHSTDIKPISLKRNGTMKSLVFTYNIKQDKVKQSYTITPCLLIVVDKKYDGKVTFVSQVSH